MRRPPLFLVSIHKIEAEEQTTTQTDEHSYPGVVELPLHVLQSCSFEEE